MKSPRSKRTKRKLNTKQVTMLQKEGEIWHARFGHIFAPHLNRLKHVPTGTTDSLFRKTLATCQICNQAKMTRKAFDCDREGASHPCQIIHADLIISTVPTYIHAQRYILATLSSDIPTEI